MIDYNLSLLLAYLAGVLSVSVGFRVSRRFEIWYRKRQAQRFQRELTEE